MDIDARSRQVAMNDQLVCHPVRDPSAIGELGEIPGGMTKLTKGYECAVPWVSHVLPPLLLAGTLDEM